MKKKISRKGRKLKHKDQLNTNYINSEFNKIYQQEKLKELDLTNKKQDLTNYKNNKNKMISTNWAKLKLEQSRKEREQELLVLKNNSKDSVIESNSQSITDNNDQSTVLFNSNIQ